MELLEAYKEPLRSFLAADFEATRKTMKLTQLKMAELLDIDLKSYSNLEHGKSLCSTQVFLRYVFRCKEDTALFMEQVKQVMEDTEARLAG